MVYFNKVWRNLIHIFHFSGQLTQSTCIKFFLLTVPLLTLGYIESIISVPKDVENPDFIHFIPFLRLECPSTNKANGKRP